MKNYIVLFIAFLIATLLRLSSPAPSIFIGVMSVITLYFLIKELFVSKEYKWLPNIASFFLAISPWHILMTSHQGENLKVFLTIVLGWVLVKGLKRKNLTTIILAVILLTTLFISYFITDVNSSIGDSTIPFLSTIAQRREHGEYFDSFATIVMHNKIINYSLYFLDHYTQHFSGDFLFIVGDIRLKNVLPESGIMYLLDILFMLWGVIFIIKKLFIKNLSSNKVFLILWFLLSPIPSAITFQPPDAIKSYNMIVPILIVSSLGFNDIFKRLTIHSKRNAIFYLVTVLVIIIFVWDFSRFLHQLFIHSR